VSVEGILVGIGEGLIGVSEVGLPGHIRVQSPACVVLLWCYLTLQPTEKSSVPLREHDLNLTISVVYGIPMRCYQRHSYVRKHSVPARERSEEPQP
jgi:hypothetical protein